MIGEQTDREKTEPGYDPAFFAELVAIEDRHFWFRARNHLIASLVGRLARRLPPAYRVLEVGCGNGNVLRHLVRVCRGATVIGMDRFAEGLIFARNRAACPVVQADAGCAPFGVGFDLVGIFDVLEHTPDDMRVLRDLYALLVPGGALLITVPAAKVLWSYFDEISHHYRRYEAPELEEKLRHVGFELELVTHYMAVIYPFVRLIRRLRSAGLSRASESLNPVDTLRSEFAISPLANALLAAVLRVEAAWVGLGNRLPFGTSLVVVARRPGLRH